MCVDFFDLFILRSWKKRACSFANTSGFQQSFTNSSTCLCTISFSLEICSLWTKGAAMHRYAALDSMDLGHSGWQFGAQRIRWGQRPLLVQQCLGENLEISRFLCGSESFFPWSSIQSFFLNSMQKNISTLPHPSAHITLCCNTKHDQRLVQWQSLDLKTLQWILALWLRQPELHSMLCRCWSRVLGRNLCHCRSVLLSHEWAAARMLWFHWIPSFGKGRKASWRCCRDRSRKRSWNAGRVLHESGICQQLWYYAGPAAFALVVGLQCTRLSFALEWGVCMLRTRRDRTRRDTLHHGWHHDNVAKFPEVLPCNLHSQGARSFRCSSGCKDPGGTQAFTT